MPGKAAGLLLLIAQIEKMKIQSQPVEPGLPSSLEVGRVLAYMN